jgi:hypothetical protein
MSYIDPKKLAEAGFTDVVEPRTNSAVIILAGLEGSGKTTWALTAPKPLFYMATDFGEQGIIQRAKGQIVRLADKDGKPKSYKLNIPHEYRAFVEKDETSAQRQKREGMLANFVHKDFYVPFYEDFKRGLDFGVKSVVWDNALDVWEYTRLSVYGRDASNRSDLQAEANNKFREMVRLANLYNVNLVLINHLKLRWEMYYDGQGQPKWRPSTEYEMQGFDKAPFLVTANLWTKFTPKDPRVEGSDPQFEVIVKKCRDHQEHVGSVYPLFPFEELMSILIPEVETW